jgi:hypothetical protein
MIYAIRSRGSSGAYYILISEDTLLLLLSLLYRTPLGRHQHAVKSLRV